MPLTHETRLVATYSKKLLDSCFSSGLCTEPFLKSLGSKNLFSLQFSTYEDVMAMPEEGINCSSTSSRYLPAIARKDKLEKNDFAQDRTGDVLRVKQMP